MEDDTIKEIYHATGGDFGGIKVDKEFQNLLDKIFGKDRMDKFRGHHPSDWLELMNDFEFKKRASEQVKKGEYTRIRLPTSFLDLLKCENVNEGEDWKSRLEAYLSKLIISENSFDGKEMKILRDYLYLGPNIVKILYKPAIESIVSHLEALLKKPELREVTHLFLVGGFSDCKFLQDSLRESFGSNYRILNPGEGQKAVMEGAVLFGQRPHIVVERCLSETYGTGCCTDFIPGTHPTEKLKFIDGKPKCSDIFDILTRKNEKVKMGECRKTSSYSPLRESQTSVTFNFFTSSNPNVRYTTDEGVRKLPGHITVESHDTSKGTDRTIELRLYFETEIKVVGVDLETGKEASTFIDFLSHAPN